MQIDFPALLSASRKSFSTKGKIYISTLCSTPCDKQMRYMFDGVEQDEDYKPWPGMEALIGDLIHDEWQKILVYAGVIKRAELPLITRIKDVDIHMSADGLDWTDSTEEYKTIGSKDYGLRAPMRKHVEQFNFYIGIRNIPAGVIRYFKRENGQHLKSFDVAFDPVLFECTKARIERILDNKLTYSFQSCNFCQYRKRCEEERRRP